MGFRVRKRHVILEASIEQSENGVFKFFFLRKARFYPKEIRKLVKEKRVARHRWQNTRDPADKAKFNRLCKETKKLIAEVNNKSFEDLLYSLGPTKDTNYSLWKMSKIKKRPPVYTPPLRDNTGTSTFTRSDSEKADLFEQISTL